MMVIVFVFARNITVEDIQKGITLNASCVHINSVRLENGD